MEAEEKQEQTLKEQAQSVLSGLTARLSAANVKEERDAAWATVQDPDTVAMLASAWAEHEADLTAQLNVIELMQGSTQRARSLKRALKRIARENRASAAVDQMLSSLGSVAVAFNQLPPARLVSPAILASCNIPRGWAIDNSGVWRLSGDGEDPVRVTHYPIMLTGRTTDVISGEAKRQVLWDSPSGWCQRTVDRQTLIESRRITSLGKHDAPVSSNNAGMVVDFLMAYESENAGNLPLVLSTEKLGWLPDGDFILPEKRVAPPSAPQFPFALMPPGGMEHTAKGCSVAGTWEGWLEAAELAKDWPLVMGVMYASAAAPLLHILKTNNFVVDVNGETTGGKTTSLRLAASVWGMSNDGHPSMMHSWDMTKVWCEQTASFLNNLPLILDDTKRAKSWRTVRDVVYDFAFGAGRGRGAKDGGTRNTLEWRSVLISSGESSITSFSQDGGTRARVLELRGQPMGNNPKVGSQIAERISEICAENYGHLGRKIVDYLVANEAHHDQIREQFKESRERFKHALDTPVARRHASNLAALELAAEVVHAIGVPRPAESPFAFFVEAARSAGKDADRPLAALQEVVNWAAAHQSHFVGRGERSSHGGHNQPSAGWAGVWARENWEYIGINGRVLRRILQDEGFHPAEVIDRWRERGWLITGTQMTRPLRLPGGVQMRCYCLSVSAVAAAMAETEEELNL